MMIQQSNLRLDHTHGGRTASGAAENRRESNGPIWRTDGGEGTEPSTYPTYKEDGHTHTLSLVLLFFPPE